MKLFRIVCVACVLVAGCSSTPRSQPPPPSVTDTKVDETYDKETILTEADQFLGKGAKGLAQIIEKAFREQGRPNAFIKGEEAAGALGIGVRYGNGQLVLRDGSMQHVYWKGPSIGFDAGANAAKTFILVYNLPSADYLFQRFPGVDGSLYFVGGVGMNYLQSGNTVLAPMRVGVGWRQGANVGYLHFSPKKSWVPF